MKSLLLTATVAIACTATVFAADRAPDLAVRTPAIEASVSLDDSLKADAALADNLLAEGRKWIAQNRRDAEKEHKTSPISFRNGPWTFERNYAAASVVADRYISVLRTGYFYTGGAHPNHDIDTILWDRTANKRISIRPFFTETADNGPTMTALRGAAIASLTVEKKARGTDTPGREWARGVTPKLIGIGAVSLAPSTVLGKSAGLVFQYPPYAVGAYAEGPYDAFVPWQTLKPYLSAQGTAIFAGDRRPASETAK
jgi:hypothetical protein